MNGILIAEDNRYSGPALAELLSASGWRVTLAATILDAREALESLDPLALIADVQMPDGDGIELVAEAKRRNPLCLCLILTAGIVELIRDRARAAGADEIMAKPVRWPDLIKLLPTPAGPETPP